MPLNNPYDPTSSFLPNIVVVRKSADEIVSNSITIQNDDELLFSVGANQVWEFLLVLRHTTPTVNPDIKWDFTIPAAGSLKGLGIWSAAVRTDDVNGTTQIQYDLAATESYFQRRYLYIGGVNAGTIQLRWAQQVATVENTTVLANSFIIAHRLA